MAERQARTRSPTSANVDARLIHGECLEAMQALPAKSVDLILCDLPYGTTACKWDAVIPFEPLWERYRRVAKDTAAIVLTASQPFTSSLITSNFADFRYCLVWDKVNRYTGFLDANKKPLKRHEDICVFYRAQPTFNKQMVPGEPYKAKRTRPKKVEVYADFTDVDSENTGTRNPFSILSVKADVKTEMGLHPTQKPVALMEYLIKTYTNEGAIVLDNCMGSGTTGVACANTGRNFIGMEMDEKYFGVASDRIWAAYRTAQ